MDMQIRFPGNRRVDAEFGGFTVRTDQSKESGGDGSAPSPFSLFLASLGTCSGYYVLAFCAKRGIPTDDITLALSADRDPESHMVKEIKMQIELPASFPAQYVDACVKSAAQCAVKKHLADAPQVTIGAHRAA